MLIKTILHFPTKLQRLDVNLNPITVLIEQNSNQYKFGSASVSYYGLFDANAKVNYDFNYAELI